MRLRRPKKAWLRRRGKRLFSFKTSALGWLSVIGGVAAYLLFVEIRPPVSAAQVTSLGVATEPATGVFYTNGTQIYNDMCISCHGDNGNRVPGVNLMDLEYLESHPDQEIADQIRGAKNPSHAFGRSSGGRLSNDEIRMVVKTLHSLAGPTASGSDQPSSDIDLPAPVAPVVNLLTDATASLKNGPHGGSALAAQGCSSCHRGNKETGNLKALTDKSPLCNSCHGYGAAGADTNVHDGVYLADFQPLASGGALNSSLKAGGFVRAQMSGVLSNTATLMQATSAHNVSGTPATIWGNQAPDNSSIYGREGFRLTCTSCHEPHSNGSYRMLRKNPASFSQTNPVAVREEREKRYTVPGEGGVVNYFGRVHENDIDMARWCSDCHSRELASEPGSPRIATGDATFNYRHNSAGWPASCLTCHVAHGTSAQVSGDAVFASVAGIDPVGTGHSGNSYLLRLDGRGVCQGCHQK